MTEWETHLRSVPVRDVPPRWRAEILAAAERSEEPVRRGTLLALGDFFRGLLWPHPAAWASLAAGWLLAGVLCVSGPRGPSLYGVTPPDLEPVRVTPETYVLHRQALEGMLKESLLSENPPMDRTRL
jgi:hypothetical protein